MQLGNSDALPKNKTKNKTNKKQKQKQKQLIQDSTCWAQPKRMEQGVMNMRN